MSLGNSLTYAFSAGRPIRSGRNEEGETGVYYTRGVLMVHRVGSVTVYRTPDPIPMDEVETFFTEHYPLDPYTVPSWDPSV